MQLTIIIILCVMNLLMITLASIGINELFAIKKELFSIKEEVFNRLDFFESNIKSRVNAFLQVFKKHQL